jgi:hypothetical protein
MALYASRYFVVVSDAETEFLKMKGHLTFCTCIIVLVERDWPLR